MSVQWTKILLIMCVEQGICQISHLRKRMVPYDYLPVCWVSGTENL